MRNLAVLFALAVLTGCPGDLEDPDRFTRPTADATTDMGVPDMGTPDMGTPDMGMPDMGMPDTEPFECDAPVLLANSCALNASCHGPGWGFDVRADAATLVATLTDTEAGGSCSGDMLVVAGDPDASALYLRVEGTTCGNRMPSTGDYLSDEELACVRAWIENL